MSANANLHAVEPDPESELPKMSFLDHLEELRKRLIVSFIAVGVGFLLCWAFADKIFGKLQEPLTKFLPPGDKLAYTRLTAPFFLYMKVAFFAGIFLAAPVVLLQLWLFIAPGLYKKERRLAAPFIIFGTLFFLIGGYFGYRILLPATCSFFVEQGKQFKQMVTIDDYFGFANTIILATGAVFETPILIFFLARIGLVTPAFLMQKFKYAVVLSFIIAAVVTPTPDMVTQSALAVPMILLYLIGVGVAYAFGKKVE
ncbi:MAG: twin-arginine translocase subunit TatC [Acidobacteria bacterium]|nr:twin-arginine translocase subunit TatC [Acidobacteriota bacterium]MBV9477572.1 twin-arginine translocase subunit TatC [Acidobacteriota bacterium]